MRLFVVFIFNFLVVFSQESTVPLIFNESDVVINEIMASNDMTQADEFGEFDDWVELYNKGSIDINLLGFHLSDDPFELGKYTFPDITISPGEYIIVWTDDDEEDQGDNHATFKLSKDGEELYFSDIDFNILDSVVFGEQATDMGYARVPNGVGNFVIQNPTFSSSNNLNSSLLSFSHSRKIIKKLDILGRSIIDSNISIDIFDDGSVEKSVVVRK